MSTPDTPLVPTPPSRDFDYHYHDRFNQLSPLQKPKDVIETGSGSDVPLFNNAFQPSTAQVNSSSSPFSLFPKIKPFNISPHESVSPSSSPIPPLTMQLPPTVPGPTFVSVDSSDDTWGYKRKRTTSFEEEERELIDQEEEEEMDDENDYHMENTSNSESLRRAQATAPKKSKVLSLEAPTQERNYITPSSTSKKPIPAYAQSQYHKWLTKQNNFGQDISSSGLLPENIKHSIEHRRRQNALSARRTRMKKAERVKELEERITGLKKEISGYERRCEGMEWRIGQLKKTQV